MSKTNAVKGDLGDWGGVHTDFVLIVHQMRDLGMTTAVMGADGIATDEYAAIGGPGTAGTFMTFPPDPRHRPTAAEVVKRVEAKGFKPEAHTLHAYAAVELFQQAAGGGKTLQPQRVAA